MINKMKSGWARIKTVAAQVDKKVKTAAVMGGVTFGSMAMAKAELVTLDAITGMPSFDASVVFAPMITAIVGIVGSAAAIWVTLAGVGFIKRFMHG